MYAFSLRTSLCVHLFLLDSSSLFFITLYYNKHLLSSVLFVLEAGNLLRNQSWRGRERSSDWTPRLNMVSPRNNTTNNNNNKKKKKKNQTFSVVKGKRWLELCSSLPKLASTSHLNPEKEFHNAGVVDTD